MVHEVLHIELPGARVPAHGDDGLVHEVRKRMRLLRIVKIAVPADGDFPEGKQRLRLQRLRNVQRCGHQGEVRETALQGLDGLGRGVVEDPDGDAREVRLEDGQLRQQQYPERGLRCGNADLTALQVHLPEQLLLAGFQLLIGHRHMLIELLPVGRETDTPVSPDHKLAAQLRLQIVHAAGNVGLIVVQHLRRLGKASVRSHVIKNPIIIKSNHKLSSFPYNYP